VDTAAMAASAAPNNNAFVFKIFVRFLHYPSTAAGLRHGQPAGLQKRGAQRGL
jgi:hypothetical protein